MKTKFAIACLIGLSFGISGIAAHAFDVSLNSYDHNRDGRLDRREYYNASRDWHRRNDHRYCSRREAYNNFNKYDRDHDGYLNDREVKEIHVW
jgi:Ca2+-binding EF-hand superfamily protein